MVPYHDRVQRQPDLPVPGKLVEPPVQGEKAQKPDVKGPGNPTAEGKPTIPAAGDQPKETTPTRGGPAAAKDSKDQAPDPKVADKPAATVAGDKPKEATTARDGPAAAKDGKDQTHDPKATGKPAAPAAGDKPKEATTAKDGPAAKDGKDQAHDPKAAGKPAAPVTGDRAKDGDKPTKDPKTPADDFSDIDPAAVRANLAEHGIVNGQVVDPAKLDAAPVVQQAMKDAREKDQGKTTQDAKTTGKPTAAVAGAKPKAAFAVTGPAAKGPAGTAISQVFDERLSPPDEKALKDLPAPKEGESFFITLHPAYLEKSQFNVFSVDQSSENFQELKKSVELVGIKDPVLARLKPEGGWRSCPASAAIWPRWP